MHIQYPKIYWLHHESCEWILDWPVFVQSKIDWANLSIRLEDGFISIWSRTQIVYSHLTLHKSFNNVQNIIPAHKGIIQLLADNPTYRLYGEFLVKHTISYPQEAYNKFYMFDILDWDKRLYPTYVYDLAMQYWIDTPSVLSNGYEMFTLDALNKIMEENKDFGVRWEGIVIKPYDFKNKRGDRQYGKLVRQEFKEKNSIVFWNINKSTAEDEFSSKYINSARVLKIINKIEQNEDRNIRIEDTPHVMWMIYHDVFEEELRGFANKKIIDFNLLQKKCNNRSRSLFHRYLNEWFLSDNHSKTWKEL